MCSGSVISPRWVLTAAHCVMNDDEDIPYNMIRIDAYYRLNTFKRYEVELVYKHPKFSFGKKDVQDLGLIRTKYPFDTNTVAKVWTSIKYPNSSCTILGYGIKGIVTKNESEIPSLSKIKVNLLPINMCQSFYTKDNPLICLFVVDGLGPCTGDSGSPMICEDKIVGVCSRAVFGNSRTACGVYDVAVILYQRIDSDWVRTMLAGEYDNSQVGQAANLLSLIIPLICILLGFF
ncbi:trypsin isoform X2 [Halyomorpha halys]|nr:trypsin-like isoform X2 [Halyomorpha halys]XP_014273890.1 trypsin-like isoform X2 [Halyomorpha halys]